MPPQPEPSAEELFADFLERIEGGETVEFEPWCEGHPQQRIALRRLYASWRAMASAFATLSGDSAAGTAADSVPLQDLLARLGGDATRWSRYALGPELARGAMGRIVAAFDGDLQRDVALKIHHGAAADGRMQRRFLEEAQIAAQLDHPGVVPIHELGIDPEGRPFFAMRLVRGATLADVLERAREPGSEWSRTRVLHVLLRVCDVLAFAHHKGVVHRDLKPANVMVGRFGEVYVMDWGLARVAARTPADHDEGAGGTLRTLRGEIEGDSADSPLLTRDGDVVGTPAYMAPEQAAGRSTTVGVAADVYSIGATLYHLLSGAPPYAAEADGSGSAALRALRGGPPAPLPLTVPGELRAICERAMARDPEQRYPDVAGFAADLRAFLELRVVSAYQTGSIAELRKWVARNRVLAAISAALVLVLIGGVATTMLLWLEARKAREVADGHAGRLAVELDRSRFRSARQALQLDDAGIAAGMLWRQHLEGSMPRASHWSLLELAQREPTLATRSLAASELSFCRTRGTLLAATVEGDLHELSSVDLTTLRSFRIGGPPLRCVAAAPDSDLVAIGDAEGGLGLLDLATGHVVARVLAHPGGVEAIAWSTAGDLASVGGDGTARRWTTALSETVTLIRSKSRLLAFTFGPDGRMACSGEEGELYVLEADGRQILHQNLGGDVLSVAFAGEDTLWAGTNQHVIHVVDLHSGTIVDRLATRNGSCRDLAQERNGTMLAAGWWRVDRYDLDRRVPRQVALINARKFDLEPERCLLAVNRIGGRIDLLDVGDADLRILGAPGAPFALSGDGRVVATMAAGELVLADLGSRLELARIPGVPRGYLSMDLRGEHVAVVTRVPPAVHVFSASERRRLHCFTSPVETVFPEIAAFDPRRPEIAVASRRGVLRHALDDGSIRGELPTDDAHIVRVRYSADGRLLATSWRGARKARLLDLESGAVTDVDFPAPMLDGQPQNIANLALDESGRRIAFGSWGGAIVVRDLVTGAVQSFSGNAGTVWSLGFVPGDSELLATASGAGALTLWDLATGEACYQDARLPGPVNELQFGADGRTLACRTAEAVVLLDLEYRERHVANLLESWIERLAGAAQPAARLAGLRAWAEQVRARSWPRWQ